MTTTSYYERGKIIPLVLFFFMFFATYSFSSEETDSGQFSDTQILSGKHEINHEIGSVEDKLKKNLLSLFYGERLIQLQDILNTALTDKSVDMLEKFLFAEANHFGEINIDIISSQQWGAIANLLAYAAVLEPKSSLSQHAAEIFDRHSQSACLCGCIGTQIIAFTTCRGNI